MNEVFYEFKEIQGNQAGTYSIEIILHFLGKTEGNLILYETKQIITNVLKVNLNDQVVETLQKIFKQLESTITLVKGKIREIFLSYS